MHKKSSESKVKRRIYYQRVYKFVEKQQKGENNGGN